MKQSAGLKVTQGCANLRQGDIILLPELLIPAEEIGRSEKLETPEGVAIISQTCDVVQSSKSYCLVAPVLIDLSDRAKKDADKGRKPLHLYLKNSDGIEQVVNLEKAISIPKVQLEGQPVTSRIDGGASGKAARQLSWRITRAFGRFPFPDEVYPAFRKLREKVQSSSGKNGNFSRVLDLVQDIRVSADQWERPGRNLTLYVIVSEELLSPIEDLDDEWEWNAEAIKGAQVNDETNKLTLDRICELILNNLDSDPNALTKLWNRFEDVLQSTLLIMDEGREVNSFQAVVLADTEMNLRMYKQTESLDLEVLSHSQINS
ncbi:hypothetical protein [Corynebacterium callunae]|uniref:Uncharacterized protein n=1 Tax=Corynebacterium callunae DSM 20147 TaxID=1121353 RepID=M1UYZ3_9CORY|nr:hypothetical protein [Corynebacterium callunae]AGG66858.1 hypothetical protein H924_07080 [Corynebacterium callunae DSM 20147]